MYIIILLRKLKAFTAKSDSYESFVSQFLLTGVAAKFQSVEAG